MEKKSNGLYKKRNCQCVNAGNQRFFVIEIKNRRRKKSRKSLSSDVEGSAYKRSQKPLSLDVSEHGENHHLTVKDLSRMLTDNLVTSAIDPERNHTNHYQKFMSAISSVFGFRSNGTTSKAIQVNKSEDLSTSDEPDSIMLSDIVLGSSKHPANFIPLTIKCSQGYKERSVSVSTDQVETNAFKKKLLKKCESSDDLTWCSLPNLPLNPYDVTYSNAFYVNQAVCRNSFKSNDDDSSDILSDDDEPNYNSRKLFLQAEQPKLNVSEKCCESFSFDSKNYSDQKLTQYFKQDEGNGSGHSNSNGEKLLFYGKHFSEFVNNILSRLTSGSSENGVSINSVHEFEKIFGSSSAATSAALQLSTKEENCDSTVESKHDTAKKSELLESQIQEFKQCSSNATPAQALMEIFGTQSHITEIISNALEHEDFLTKIQDPRFRTIRSDDGNESGDTTKMAKNVVEKCISKEEFIEIVDQNTDMGDSSANSYETAEFQINTNNPFLYLKGNLVSSDAISLSAHSENRDLLITMQERFSHIETHLIYLQDYLSDVKKDMFEHCRMLDEQQNIVKQRGECSNFEDTRVMCAIDCDELCQTYLNLESTSSRNRFNMDRIRKLTLRVNSKFIASIAFFVGFMCGDFVRK